MIRDASSSEEGLGRGVAAERVDPAAEPWLCERTLCTEGPDVEHRRSGGIRLFDSGAITWRRAALALGVLCFCLSVALITTVALMSGKDSSSSGERVDGVGADFDLGSARSRYDLLARIRSASGSEINDQAAMADFRIDPTNYRRYVTGQHRRPTDPATPDEISSALGLLFGVNGTFTSLAEADALANAKEAWATANAALSPSHRVYPEYVSQANRIANRPMDRSAAEAAFVQQVHASGGDVDAAHAWLRKNDDVRQSLIWYNVQSTTTHVADKWAAVDVDADIDDGLEPDFSKLVGVKLSGGLTELKENGDVYGATVYVTVDVTHIESPFVVAEYCEAYSSYGGNTYDPGQVKLTDTDFNHLKQIANALYGSDQWGNPREWLPFCQSDPNNRMMPTCSANGGWGAGMGIRYFVKPFAWKDGFEHAATYGGQQHERVLSVQLAELSPSILPMDGQQITTGTFMFPSPLSMLRSVAYGSNAETPRVDAHNNLPSTEAIALTFYGRGLTFADPAAFKQALEDDDRTAICTAVADAIAEAWGEDDVGGVKPGTLTTRASDGAKIPAIVSEHPYDTPSYANHATPTVVRDAFSSNEKLKELRKGAAPHRDIRDNPPHSRPPIDPETGLPVLAPNGKHLETVGVNGPSFEIDGYAVTYDVGLVWKFNLGYDSDGGLTIYNARIVLPPTAEFPEGELVPYAFRMGIPNFGTAYATSAVGNIYSATFLENHFSAGMGLVPGSNCRGPHRTLPLFRAQGQSVLGEYADYKIFYSSYGLDPAVYDPFSKDAGYGNLPFQEFALNADRQSVGIISDAVCLSESDTGHAMWHLYSAQRHRRLTVQQTTISDSYNVVLSYEFLSDGKAKIAERLQGKPAIVNMGLPKVGGAFATGGKGGYASNHIHWHAVLIEPHVRRNLPGVRNKLVVADLGMDEDDSNWYGMAFNRMEKEVKWSNDTELLKFDYKKNRFWVLAAEDANGTDLGGLAIRSPAWGPPPFEDWRAPPMRYSAATNFTAEQTFANHWWLTQDAYVQNADFSKARLALLSQGRTSECRVGSAKRCLPDERIDGNPVCHFLMKLYHSVTTDELPVQNGFNIVEVDIWPHNLFKFNPNLLVRYMPGYAKGFQNNDFYKGDVPIYTPPYESEWRWEDEL